MEQSSLTILSEEDLLEAGIKYFIDYKAKPRSKYLKYKNNRIPLVVNDKLTSIPYKFFKLNSSSSNIKINNLHQRFGHVNCKYLLDSISHGTIVAEKSDTSDLKNVLQNEGCVDCMLGKAKRSNAVKSSRSPYVVDKPFAKVYSDVSEVNAKYVKKNDHKCFITFRCAYTGYTVVQLMKKKSEAYDKIFIFVNWVHQQFTPHKILEFFSDNGREYINNNVSSFFNEQGIEHHFTSAYTPASNGNAERLNLTLFNDCRTMLHAGRLPSQFWADAILYSAYLRNYVYHKDIKNSPAGYLGYKPLNTKKIHIFGEKCAVTIPPDVDYDKIDTRAHIGIYLGYDHDTYGHIVYVPKQLGNLSEGFYEYTRHVKFFPQNPLYTQLPFDHSLDSNQYLTHPPSLIPDQHDDDISSSHSSTDLEYEYESDDSDITLESLSDYEPSDDSSTTSSPIEDPSSAHNNTTPVPDKTSTPLADASSQPSLQTTTVSIPSDSDSDSSSDDEVPLSNYLTDNNNHLSTDTNVEDLKNGNTNKESPILITDSSSDSTDASDDEQSDTAARDTLGPEQTTDTHIPNSTSTVASSSTLLPAAEPIADNSSFDTQDLQDSPPNLLTVEFVPRKFDSLHDTEFVELGNGAPTNSFTDATSSPATSHPEEPTNFLNKKFQSLPPPRRLKRKRRDDIVVDPTPLKRAYIAPRLVNHFSITINHVNIIPIPKSYRAAVTGTHAAKWISAIKSELLSHKSLGTWSPMPIIISDSIYKDEYQKFTVTTQWVFTIKTDGTFKARLVARGDQQSHDTFNLTYSPTLRPDIARLILSTCASRHWYFQQIDIKTAYLNSPLDTTMYIQTPQGLSQSKCPSGKRVLYRLQKALYGLKQSGRLWHETISAFLGKLNFVKDFTFPSTFIQRNKKGSIGCIIGIFVDDFIIIAKSKSTLRKILTKLNSEYEVKLIKPNDKGYQQFLGMDMKVYETQSGKVNKIELSQFTYIEKLITELSIHITKRKPSTPLTPGFYFDPMQNQLILSEKELKVATTSYRQLIGSLLYVSLMTRPDITYAVNYLARFATYPHKTLLKQIHRVINYLNDTKSFKLSYGNNKKGGTNVVECYCDSDYAQEPTTRKSMTGYIYKINGDIISWNSKYTPLVCQSSTQAELQGAVNAINELTWIMELLKYFGEENIVANKPILFIDNQSAIDTIINCNFSSSSKHYMIRYKMLIQQYHEFKLFDVKHIASEFQLADVLTKPVDSKVIKFIKDALFKYHFDKS